MEMMQKLENLFGYDTPILLNEIKMPGSTEVGTRQMIKRLADRGYLERFGQGVYYIPKMTLLGKSRLSAKKVYEKKYILDGNRVYGFYAGLTLENAIGLTNKVPNIIEIVTNCEGSRVREVTIGSQKIRLRKSLIEVTADNAKVLQFLDLVNRIDFKSMSKESVTCLKTFVKKQNLKRDEVFLYSSYYPSRTAKKLIESGLIYELA